MKTKLLVIICFFTCIFTSNAQVEITSGGTAMAYTLSIPGAFALKAGIQVTFKANVVCGTPVTINVNSTGAILIKKEGATLDLAANDIRAGQIVNLVYDGSFWQMLSVSGNTTGSGANLFLSNLSSPTAINQSLVPNISNSIDFGTSSKEWNNFYLGGMLYLEGAPWMNNPNTNNTMIGTRSDNSALTSALYNTSVGSLTGNALTTGFRNTIMGHGAGQNLNTQSDNTLIGTLTGGLATNLGSSNTFLGSYAGYGVSNAGSNNTFIGESSGQSNTTGGSNTFVGYHTGYSAQTTSTTTVLGYMAGSATNPVTGGTDNTFVGANTGLGSATQRTNATAIGANAKVNADNALILGDNVNVGIGTSSPGSLLDIGPATNASLRVTNTNSTSGYAAYFNNTSATNTAAALVVQVANAASPSATFMGGNVGIGTTAPTSLFSVGTGAASPFQVNSSGNIIKLNGATTNFPTTNTAGVLTNDGTGTLTWGAAAGAITASNGLTKTVNDIQLGGTLSANTTITHGNFDMIYNLSGTGNFDIQDAGVSKFYVKNTGFVGINNNAPLSPLHVVLSTTAVAHAEQIDYTNTSATAGNKAGLFVNHSGNHAAGNVSHGILVTSAMTGGGTGGIVSVGGYASGSSGTKKGVEASATGNGTGNIALIAQCYGLGATTNYGVYADAQNSSGTNYGIYATASGGTSNYAIVVPSTGGNVGIGTTAPGVLLDVVATSSIVANEYGIRSNFTTAVAGAGSNKIAIYGYGANTGAGGGSGGIGVFGNGGSSNVNQIGVVASVGYTLNTLPTMPTAYSRLALFADNNGVGTNPAAYFRGKVVMGVDNTASASSNAMLCVKDGHIQTQQTAGAPFAIAAGTNVTAASINGTDIAGQLSFTPGVTSGIMVTVTFKNNYTSTASPVVIITPISTLAAAAMGGSAASGASKQVYISYQGSAGAWTGFVINYSIAPNIAPAVNTGPNSYNYMVIETQ